MPVCSPRRFRLVPRGRLRRRPRPDGTPAVFLAIGLCFGCSSDRRPPVAPPPEASVRFLRPADGDSAAGTVRIEARVSDSRVRVLYLRIDGAITDALAAPDWSATWRPPDVIEPLAVGLALCESPAGVRASDSLAVIVIPNGAPRLRLEWPRPTRWLERAPGVALVAVALDPEDGAVPPARIRWTGDRLRRPLTGATLPIELLPEEEQSVEVQATDRWGAGGVARASLRPFRYAGGETPEGCLHDLAGSYRGLDPLRLPETLDPQFRFVPCSGEAESAGWPRAWARADFSAMWHRWITDPGIGWPEWELRVRRLAGWSHGDTTVAWFASESSRLIARTAPTSSPGAVKGLDRSPAVLPPESPSEAVEITSAHGFLLRRAPGDRWRVLVWREHLSAEGPSLASRLAAASGWSASSGSPAGRRELAEERPTVTLDGSRAFGDPRVRPHGPRSLGPTDTRRSSCPASPASPSARSWPRPPESCSPPRPRLRCRRRTWTAPRRATR